MEKVSGGPRRGYPASKTIQLADLATTSEALQRLLGGLFDGFIVPRVVGAMGATKRWRGGV